MILGIYSKSLAFKPNSALRRPLRHVYVGREQLFVFCLSRALSLNVNETQGSRSSNHINGDTAAVSDWLDLCMTLHNEENKNNLPNK